MQIITGKIQSAQKVVVYGPEGIGKSTFASKFPGVVFIDTEGSTKHMNVARTPKPSSWTMLLEQVRYFKTNKEIGTLVIDTADWAEQLCITEICAKAQKNGIEDFGYGKGYIYLAEEFGRLLNLLEDLVEVGINVALTAHAQMRKFEQPDEMGSYDRWELKLGKKTAPLVKEWADMVLFANYQTHVINVDGQGAQKGKNKVQGGKRIMYTSHHPCWDAKNRHDLGYELPFDYGQIAHCITSRSAIEPAEAQPVAEPAQIQAPLETVATAENKEAIAPETPNEPPEEITQEAIQPEKEEAIQQDIPKALNDLLIANQVKGWEIQRVVASKGYYPINTPIKNYDEGFINGVLVGAWNQVFEMIKEKRIEFDEDVPF